MFTLLTFLIIALSLFVVWNLWVFLITLKMLLSNGKLQGLAVPFNIVEDKLVGMIKVGTPIDKQDQKLKVALSVTSANFWLRSVDLCENKDCSGQTFSAFDGRRSQTYAKRENRQFSEKYSTGSEVRGLIAEDTIRFGGEKKGLAVEKQEFGEINSITGNFDGIDGILGLGLVTSSQYHEAVVWTLARQTKVEPVFGIYFYPLGRRVESDGLVVFGGNDKDLALYDFDLHDVVKDKENKYTGWIISVDKAIIQYPGKIQEDLELSVDRILPDPAQNEISLPQPDFNLMVDKIFAKLEIPHVGTSFKCAKWQQLPELIFVINGVKYSLLPKHYVIQVNGAPYGENCELAILSSGADRNIRLGRVFMKKYYTRFHIGRKQVQFSMAAGMD